MVDEDEDTNSTVKASDDERNSLLLTIINMFPSHVLRRFGYVGNAT
jgi:hypothetical protein